MIFKSEKQALRSMMHQIINPFDFDSDDEKIRDAAKTFHTARTMLEKVVARADKWHLLFSGEKQ